MRRLKILVLGTRGFPNVQGGVEKHCEELYPRLVKLGCDVTVITRSPYIPLEQRVVECKNVKFIHLWAPKQKNFEAITHTFLGIIIAWLKKPDILHIHAIGPSLLVPIAKLLGLNVVMTHHGPDYRRQKWNIFAKFVLKLGEFLGLKFADGIIVISKTIKEFLEKKYNRKDINFIPNGVNIYDGVQSAECLKQYNLEPKKYLFTVCRFVPEKGLHNLIEAYLGIANPEFKLVISGDADYETAYSRNIKAIAKKNSNIVLTGVITGKSLMELYSNACLFVLPSYYEGLPIALLEALSYGLPVLVSDIPQNRELPLEDFRYFKVGDVKMLSEKIVELTKLSISEDEKQKYLKILIESYNWDKIAEKTVEVYKKVLNH